MIIINVKNLIWNWRNKQIINTSQPRESLKACLEFCGQLSTFVWLIRLRKLTSKFVNPHNGLEIAFVTILLMYYILRCVMKHPCTETHWNDKQLNRIFNGNISNYLSHPSLDHSKCWLNCPCHPSLDRSKCWLNCPCHSSSERSKCWFKPSALHQTVRNVAVRVSILLCVSLVILSTFCYHDTVTIT